MMDFDARAADFDTPARAERARVIADAIRGCITDGRKGSAIEYGCGTGLVGFHLADMFQMLTFIDASPGMIAQVEAKLRERGNPAGLTALCCDFLTELPPNLNADYIFMSLVLHHVKDIGAILSRFYAALADGGHCLIVDLHKDDGGFHADEAAFDGHDGFEPSRLGALAADFGFKPVAWRTFYHGQKQGKNGMCAYSLFILDLCRKSI